MPADFRSVNLPVPGGTGTKTVEDTVIFGSPVQRADTALRSFLFDYSSEDHHINVVEATTGVVSINGNTVRVRAVCRYADKNFDDAYTGRIQLLVVAQVA